MERKLNTKFYSFYQNNSGGYCIVNDDVGDLLIVEAVDCSDAEIKANKITEDYSSFCSCCGERWSTDYPTEIQGDDYKQYIHDHWLKNCTVIVHFFGGTKEKIIKADGELQ